MVEQSKKDLGENFTNNTDIQHIFDGVWSLNGDIVEKVQDSEMYLQKLSTENLGTETYIIKDFDLDLSKFTYVPIENEILIRNMLNNMYDVIVVRNGVIDFNTIKPEKYLVDEIRQISEIDYEKCPEIIQKVVMQFLTYFRNK